jgi:hypothetical protein
MRDAPLLILFFGIIALTLLKGFLGRDLVNFSFPTDDYAFAPSENTMRVFNKHEVQYTDENGWMPPWIASDKGIHKIVGHQKPLGFVESQFFNYSAHRKYHSSTKMLAFIRIPKTGSSSLLSWVASDGRTPHLKCVFGPLNHKEYYPKEFNQDTLLCPHRTYTATVLNWAKNTLPLFHPQTQQSSLQTITEEQYYSLQCFTVVRDPYDRLVSHFYYSRRIYPNWSRMSTPQQNATILANNISGWMELLHHEGGTPYHFHYQKGMFVDKDTDLSKAVTLIQGDSPRIFTVIQECLEASMLLLAERYPQFFSMDTTKRFLNASNSENRQNTKSKLQKEDATELRGLRAKAKTWFEDDFNFYDTAVHQFRSHLAKSNVDQSVVQECIKKLDRRKEEDAILVL